MSKFVAAIAGWITLAMGIEWGWNLLTFDNVPKIWAFTVTTFFFLGYLAFSVCLLRQGVLQNRVEDCARAKRQMEEQVLLRRRSSRSGGEP